jgi:2-aminoethylphosphonate-pyruvate transaminase
VATQARDEAIRAILARHGTDAIYVASTGYVSRAVGAIAGDRHTVFYMQGSMGLAPSIGLGIALNTDLPVVVINGDGSLLMGLGATHTIRDRAPATFFHYVLDNGCHESVGGQPCAPLEPSYPGVTEVIKVSRGDKPPRVGIEPRENTRLVRRALARSRGLPPAPSPSTESPNGSGRPQLLFTPGPVNLHPEIKRRLFEVEYSHRQPEFEELVGRVRSGLHAAAGLDSDEYGLALLHGSGTLAVDAGLTGAVRGRVLTVINGVYGERFLNTLGPQEDAEVIEHRPGLGSPPDLALLEAEIEQQRPDWVAVVHHETTTGLLNPLDEIAEIATRHGSRLFVDAVSSLGAHRVAPTADVVCFNSSKCLESLPGIGGVFWRRDLEPQATVPALDIRAYSQGMPSTPSVQAFVALDIALALLAAEDRPARYERLAHAVWQAGSLSFDPLLPEGDRSHVLTAFRLGGRDPDRLFRTALAHGYVIYRGQDRLRDEIFRVANMGPAIDESAIEDLFRTLAS